MKIVVLDGYTLNPGDLSWDSLKEIGELTVYDRTPSALIPERIKDTEIVFTNKTPLDRETILAADSLKYIGVLATGLVLLEISINRTRRKNNGHHWLRENWSIYGQNRPGSWHESTCF